MAPKKRGRSKKRGPKKKRPPKVYKVRHTWDYKVVSCRNGKRNGYYGKYVTSKDAYRAVNLLLEASKQVVFPKKVVNSSGYRESYDEYLILKRNKGSETNPLLRNDYGKLVEHKTNTEKWVVFDKFRYYVEETFWVYGYDPKTDRKTFTWIYDNILVGKITNRYDYKRVMLYANKVIIKDDYAEMDLIICKNRSDAIRFYNMLQEKATNDKHKEIVFHGAYRGKSKRTSALIQDVMNYTGWTWKKVVRQTTL